MRWQVERRPAPAAAAQSARTARRAHPSLSARLPLLLEIRSRSTARNDELDAATWARVFREAAGLGVLQVMSPGGEPASRRDLVEITAAAHAAGLYTNLITSGVGVTAER